MQTRPRRRRLGGMAGGRVGAVSAAQAVSWPAPAGSGRAHCADVQAGFWGPIRGCQRPHRAGRAAQTGRTATIEAIRLTLGRGGAPACCGLSLCVTRRMSLCGWGTGHVILLCTERLTLRSGDGRVRGSWTTP